MLPLRMPLHNGLHICAVRRARQPGKIWTFFVKPGINGGTSLTLNKERTDG